MIHHIFRSQLTTGNWNQRKWKHIWGELLYIIMPEFLKNVRNKVWTLLFPRAQNATMSSYSYSCGSPTGDTSPCPDWLSTCSTGKSIYPQPPPVPPSTSSGFYLRRKGPRRPFYLPRNSWALVTVFPHLPPLVKALHTHRCSSPQGASGKLRSFGPVRASGKEKYPFVSTWIEESSWNSKWLQRSLP